jgi:hypothetical protein
LNDTDEASRERSREEFPGDYGLGEASQEHSREEFQDRWLTYDDISRIRGIGRPSAVKLVQREGWQRRPGNDGTARILVPMEWLKPAKKEASREPSREELPLLQETLVILRDQLGVANRRADEAEKQAEAAHKRADVAVALTDRTLAQLAEANAEHAAAMARAERAETLFANLETDAATKEEVAAQLRAERDQARQHAREAEDQIEVLRRADEERKGRGRWARLRTAWRGG